MPRRTPRLSPLDVERLVTQRLGKTWTGVVLLGIRGYYLNSYGKRGVNDRGFYDDALFWIARDKSGTITAFHAFQANVDPSRYRKGEGTGSRKGMASLKNGVWRYKKGWHRGRYRAFRQAAAVTVKRDGINGPYEDTGWFGINIHRGGWNTTGSAGCQTLPPDTWRAFKEIGYGLMDKHNQNSFRYVLRGKL